MRKRLEKYEFNMFPRMAAEGAMASLETLASQAAPRVRAAVISTYWNRWMTQDKMGNGKSSKAIKFRRRNSCMFGCTVGSDSLDHYAVCEVVGDMGQRLLGLRCVSDMKDRRTRFFLLDRNFKKEDNKPILRGACLLYALYNTHNFYRYNPFSSVDTLMEITKQNVRESAKNSPTTMAAIDTRGAFVFDPYNLDNPDPQTITTRRTKRINTT